MVSKKMEVVGGKQGGTSLQGAHHNLTWQLYFPNKIGVMWEVGGSGEAHVSSIGDVDGYSSVRLSLHIASGCSCSSTCYLAFKVISVSLGHMVLKMEILIDQTRGANSKHVLHLCADTSSRLGSFFCIPNQWPFLVVWWNQIIPQQGSYNQTFNVLIW